jgi:hypothetical protein
MPMDYKTSLPEGEGVIPLKYIQVIGNVFDDVITINLYSC